MKAKLRFAILALLTLAAVKTFAQAPNITYTSPKVFYEDFIDTLAPANTGGAVPSGQPIPLVDGFYGNSIARDASGNIFFGTSDPASVYKLTPAGVLTMVVTGLGEVYGIAVDAAGNLYIADLDNNDVVKVAAGANTFTTYATGFNEPEGIAVDASGNVYVCDVGSGKLKEIPAGGGTPVIYGSGITEPGAVAVDAAGNVYLTDGTHLKKIAPGNGAITTIGNPGAASGIAVDALQNVYCIESNLSAIVEIPAVGAGPVQLPGVAFNAYGLAIDPQNNFYFIGEASQAEGYGDAVLELPFGGYKISPTVLPAGLSFNVNTGYITGKPTAISPATNYVITAYNVGGSSNTTVNIAVKLPAKPVISYASPQVYQVAIAIPPLVPTNTGYKGSWVVTPALPAGLTLDYTTGIITGTPKTVKAAANYTVLAANDGGHTTFVLNITIDPTPKAIISYNTPDVFTAGQTITKLSPTNTGGPLPTAAGTYAISPALPAGLVFNTTTGVITGTPSAAAAATNYTVTATNTGGGATTIINITVNLPPPPVFSYSTPKVFALNQAVSPVTPVSTGGPIPTTGAFNISPALPAGLNFNIVTGGISGTPTALSPATNYTVTATNDGGTGTAIINITVGVPSTNSSLSGLLLSSGTLAPAFNASTTAYTTSISGSVPSITLTPTATVAGSTIKVNGAVVASGSPSQAITLTEGSNTITTVVTAQDGVSTTTYTLTVTKAASTISTLSNLTISKGSLSPAFASGTTSYTNLVTNGTTSVTLTPTVTDPTATITVNGAAVVSGSASAPVTLAVGSNPVTVVVTAQDGTTTSTYNINIVRPSTNAKLSNLTISDGALKPVFNTDSVKYSDYVPYAVSTITVTPTATVSGSTITVNGVAVASGSASAPIALIVGVTPINIVVTAQDGVTTDTYLINVERPAGSTNANLAALAVSKGTLSPAFAVATVAYTDMVTNGTASVTVTPTLSNINATVTVNGTPVASGQASGPVALAVGSNIITILVTAQNGTSTKTYKVTVIRPSTNAKLSALAISSGTLAPVFNTNTVTYTASETSGVSSITLTPTVAVTGATVTINGTAIASGSASSPIALVTGSNKITVIVTAQDGVTTDTYTLTVTKTAAASTNNNLSALAISKGTLTPTFVSTTTTYTDVVTNGTASVTVTPTVADATATVTVNGTAVVSGKASGAITLAVGSNVINTVVTAQSGATKTYTITVTRPSTNAKLSALALSSGTLTPAFNTNTTSYTASVTNATTTIKVTPTVAVTGATVKINGTAVASGVASGAISLVVGSNTITTVVTAQDGLTTDTYLIKVTRGTAGNIPDAAISVDKPTETPKLLEDDLTVHQGISPNGDGINDFLQIDNIANYPDNKLSIMNRNGQLVYESKGYDNATKVFDGHSNKTGQMQLPGTYFYELDYTVGGAVKHKTGFLVLKY